MNLWSNTKGLHALPKSSPGASCAAVGTVRGSGGEQVTSAAESIAKAIREGGNGFTDAGR